VLSSTGNATYPCVASMFRPGFATAPTKCPWRNNDCKSPEERMLRMWLDRASLGSIMYSAGLAAWGLDRD